MLHHNSFTFKLQVNGGGSVPVRLNILVYCTGTFTHISVRVILLMDGQKVGVLETAGVLYTECQGTKRSTRIMPTLYILH
jgi:hypothetical protein